MARRPCGRPAGLSCRPFSVSHDGGLTCGFRFEGPRDVLGHAWALGYALERLTRAIATPIVARTKTDIDDHLVRSLRGPVILFWTTIVAAAFTARTPTPTA